MSVDARFEIAYEEAKRAISDQQEALDAIQTRAGLTGSAAAVVASLVADRLSGREGSLSFALEIALVGYLSIAICVGFVLWPRRKWRFHFQASTLHWSYIEGPAPVDANLMQRDLALYLDLYFEENARKIDRMSWAFGIALGLLLLVSIAFVYDVVGG
jgi:hypothetical protein